MEQEIATRLRTSEGEFVAWFSDQGLTKLEFPARDTTRSMRSRAPRLSPEQRRWVAITSQALEHVLAGRRPEVMPPFDWRGHTPFRVQVWRSLLRVSAGDTRTYRELGAELGRPRAARAIGGACAANPIPVLVPCHRVIRTDGGLGGFSGGLDWKRRLLAREGVRTAPLRLSPS